MKFPTPCSTWSLFTSIRPNTKGNFRTIAILLFYALQKCYLFRRRTLSKLYYFVSFRNIEVIVASGAAATYFARQPCCCCSWLQDTRIYSFEVSSSCMTFILSFVNIGRLFKSLRTHGQHRELKSICFSCLGTIFFYWRYNPLWFCILQPSSGAIASSNTRFLYHTQRRATVGRTPLDEWSGRRRDLYLTTHNTHNRQTSMPPVGFERTIAAGERP